MDLYMNLVPHSQPEWLLPSSNYMAQPFTIWSSRYMCSALALCVVALVRAKETDMATPLSLTWQLVGIN